MNPLLDFSGLPRFAEVKPEHVAPAVEQLLEENRALIARLLDDISSPTWDNFMQPLDDANERLSRAWGQVGAGGVGGVGGSMTRAGGQAAGGGGLGSFTRAGGLAAGSGVSSLRGTAAPGRAAVLAAAAGRGDDEDGDEDDEELFRSMLRDLP